MIRSMLLLLCGVFLVNNMTWAQDVTEEPTRNWLTIVVDSARIRVSPARDSEPVGSRVEGDRLEAVGRNADGTWLQVTAPYSDTPMGWIAVDLVSYNFEITLLPFADTTTGVTGDTPIVDIGVSVVITQNARLRTVPARTGTVIQVIPNGVTIPVIARNPAGDWLQVNYNGTVGWVAVFLIHTVNDLGTLSVITPSIPGVGSGSLAPVRVITADQQLAQINRLRAFVASPLAAAQGLGASISSVVTGEIVPCTPTSSQFDHYTYTAEDVRQLPELGRYGPTINSAVDGLNEAINLIGGCGVYTEATVAQATALLPTGFFYGILARLDRLEQEILTA